RQVHASREPAAGTEALEAITRDLIAWLEDPANATEPLSLLRRRLALSTGDVLTFLICLAPELDLNYQLIFGHIHDDMSRRYATAALADVFDGRASDGGSAQLHRNARALASDRGRRFPRAAGRSVAAAGRAPPAVDAGGRRCADERRGVARGHARAGMAGKADRRPTRRSGRRTRAREQPGRPGARPAMDRAGGL